ncbi:MAG: ribose-phosphate pyrophosphokinase-like domain-containing protein, partial [Sediminibacterium sp.]
MKFSNYYFFGESLSSPHIPSIMNPSVKIFSGTGSQKLAEKIAQQFGAPIGKINIQKFSDGEFQPIFLESIRGDYVFLVQSTYAPTDNLMEL